MLRSLLALLASLPLLMPPGMCLCQFVPVAAAGSISLFQSGKTAEARESAKPASCRCKHHCTQDADMPSKAEEGTAPVSHDDTPDSCPREHLPGCPALTPMVNRVGLPGFSIQTWFILPTATVAAAALLQIPDPAPVPALHAVALAPDLHLTHCSFVI